MGQEPKRRIPSARRRGRSASGTGLVALLVPFSFVLLLSSRAPAWQEPVDPQTPDRGSRRGITAVTEVEAPDDPVGYARRHALIIGIDDYRDPGFPDLGHATADARGMATALVEKLGFAPDHLRLLLDEEATRASIEAALEDWACDPAVIGPEDLLVVFFAGHGETRDIGERGKRGYLVPSDARKRDGRIVWSSLLAMTDLEDISEAVPAKHVLFILDCCFGGLAVKRSAPPVAAGLGSRARQVLTAGSADQEVLDGGGGGHSVFTASVLEALEGKADLDRDRVVTFGELFNHVGRTVEQRTGRRQTPLQATLQDHGGGCVALFPPGVKPHEMTSAAERLKTLEKSQKELLEEVLRLSDVHSAGKLIAAADRLFPCVPERVPDMVRWLAEAETLLSHRPRHEESLTALRQEAYLQQVVAGLIEEGETRQPVWEEVDSQLVWRHATTLDLLARFDELQQAIVEVRKRMAFARTVHRETIERYDIEWKEAISSIRNDCPAYGGLVLEPQLGLIPLGRDPESGLWEFGHLQTGAIPERDDDGSLQIDRETGLVFVLIPGGEFLMGSRTEDPESPNFYPGALSNESPVHRIRLAPFFLSKYEMTQAQWERATGENPSYYEARNYIATWQRESRRIRLGLHPVEQVSWEQCRIAMERLGLELPTEAQWEYAARAGTTSVWWTGDNPRSLEGACNLADAYRRDHGGARELTYEDWLDDGYTVHAPIGRFKANPFGLHDTAGNVWEWCQDLMGSYTIETNPGDGRRMVPLTPGLRYRIARGGSFDYPAGNARSAYRNYNTPENAANSMGVRPAREISGGRGR